MYSPKSAKSQQTSLSQQNSVKFGTDFTQVSCNFTQALLARLYVFFVSLIILAYIKVH